jgi:hypothetical protein
MATRKTPTRKKTTGKRPARKRWSQRVTQTSDALTLDRGVFSRDDPRSIARSLKRFAGRPQAKTYCRQA